MHPVLFKFGPFTIFSYGVMLAVAVMVCSYFLGRDAKKAGLACRQAGVKSEVVFDLVFWTLIGGLAGARIFYIFLKLSFFIQNPLEIVMIQHGGLAWQGGLLGGFGAGLWFARRKKLPIVPLLDLTAPYIALGQAIGRVGCFLNGCCYGKPAARGIYFPVHGDHLHPTQLYDSLGLLAIFLILKGFQRRRALKPGSVFVLYLLLASSLRFIVEFFRADHELLWGGLSIFQWICAGIISAVLAASFFVCRRQRL